MISSIDSLVASLNTTKEKLEALSVNPPPNYTSDIQDLLEEVSAAAAEAQEEYESGMRKELERFEGPCFPPSGGGGGPVSNGSLGSNPSFSGFPATPKVTPTLTSMANPMPDSPLILSAMRRGSNTSAEFTPNTAANLSTPKSTPIPMQSKRAQALDNFLDQFDPGPTSQAGNYVWIAADTVIAQQLLADGHADLADEVLGCNARQKLCPASTSTHVPVVEQVLQELQGEISSTCGDHPPGELHACNELLNSTSGWTSTDRLDRMHGTCLKGALAIDLHAFVLMRSVAHCVFGYPPASDRKLAEEGLNLALAAKKLREQSAGVRNSKDAYIKFRDTCSDHHAQDPTLQPPIEEPLASIDDIIVSITLMYVARSKEGITHPKLLSRFPWISKDATTRRLFFWEVIHHLKQRVRALSVVLQRGDVPGGKGLLQANADKEPAACLPWYSHVIQPISDEMMGRLAKMAQLGLLQSEEDSKRRRRSPFKSSGHHQGDDQSVPEEEEDDSIDQSNVILDFDDSSLDVHAMLHAARMGTSSRTPSVFYCPITGAFATDPSLVDPVADEALYNPAVLLSCGHAISHRAAKAMVRRRRLTNTPIVACPYCSKDTRNDSLLPLRFAATTAKRSAQSMRK